MGEKKKSTLNTLQGFFYSEKTFVKEKKIS